MDKWTAKEKELFVMHIVQGIIEISEKENISFSEAMEDNVFVAEANLQLSELICKTMELLYDKGCISGTLEIVREIELDIEDLDKETGTDNIDFYECVMEDISITSRGKLLFAKESLENIGIGFISKAKSIIKELPTIALQTIVELSVTALWKSAGLLV